MTELGEAPHILGMRIEPDRLRKILRLLEREYVRKVLGILNTNMEKW